MIQDLIPKPTTTPATNTPQRGTKEGKGGDGEGEGEGGEREEGEGEGEGVLGVIEEEEEVRSSTS